MFKDFLNKITGQQKHILIMIVEIVLVVAVCAASIAGVAIMSANNNQTESNSSVASVSSTESISSEELISSEEVSSMEVSSTESYVEPTSSVNNNNNNGENPTGGTSSTTGTKPYSEQIRTWSSDRFLPDLPKAAPVLDYVSTQNLTQDEQFTFTALQGIVNKSQPRIYTTGQAPEKEMNSWVDNLSLKFNKVNSPYDLITKYKDEINGIVAYSTEDQTQHHTINLATTIAAVEKCLPVNAKNAAEFSKKYGLPIKYNMSSLDIGDSNTQKLEFRTHWEIYEYQLEKFGPRTTNRVILSMNPTNTGIWNCVRDYIIAIGGMTIWLDPDLDRDMELLDQYLVRMPSGQSTALGWWPSENSGVFACTGYGIGVLASDYSTNLSVYAGMQTPITPQAKETQKKLENKVYIAMAIADGDNLQYMQGHMFTLWNEDGRGTYPISWTTTPSTLDVARPVLNYYYTTKSSNDYFIVGPSAYNYIYPKAWNENRLDVDDPIPTLAPYLQRTNSYMKAAGMRVITVWNWSSGANELTDTRVGRRVIQTYADNLPDVLGFTQQEGGPTAVINGDFMVRPAEKSYCSEVYQMKQGVEDVLKRYYANNGENPEFYMIQMVPWGNSIEKLNSVVRYANMLSSDVEFVSVNQLMMLQTAYIKSTQK